MIGPLASLRGRNMWVGPQIDFPPSSVVMISISARSFRKVKLRGNFKPKVQLFVLRISPTEKFKVTEPKLNSIIDEFQDIFQEKFPNGLPQEQPQELEINIVSVKTPPAWSVSSLSHAELQQLRLHIHHLLEKGLLRPSCSLHGALVFFGKQKGKLRMVCDCRTLNSITISDVGQLS